MSDDILNDPTLADPYSDSEVKYNWDEEFQRHVISLVISDRQFLLQSLDLIKPSYFTNKAHSKVCQITFDFFEKYRILPRKDFLVQELKSELKDNKALTYYLTEVTLLYDYFQPGLESRDYLTDKITYFAKIQSVRKAFNESLKLIDNNPECEETWNKIYDKMREATLTHSNFEIGIDYFRSIQDRYAKMLEDQSGAEVFLTGFPSLDVEISGGGFGRKEIISVAAGSGVGKSLWLANLTATNLLRGKRGIYFSFELSEPKIAARMDSIMSGFPIQNLYGHKDEIFERLKGLSVAQDGDVGPLIIKEFPAGTATVNTLRAYISQIRFHGFVPDFVIVDYVGEMKHDPALAKHDAREIITRDLRAMAHEENVFVATAMQPNRTFKDKGKGGERDRIDDENLADSYNQKNPLDGLLSLNQNDTEKLLGIGRAFTIKLRDGKSRFQFYLSFNKETLKISEISQREYMELLNSHKEYVSEETKIDMVVNGGWKPSEEKEKDKNNGEQ